MLDTDTVSLALRGQGSVSARVLGHRPSQLCISSVTLAELRFGAEAKASRKLHGVIDTFVESVAVLPFDPAAADRFGPVARALARRAEPIGTFDTLIAAHALSCGLVLVTNNTRHFQRVAGLKMANWAQPAERPPNTALHPTGAGGAVSAGGKACAGPRTGSAAGTF